MVLVEAVCFFEEADKRTALKQDGFAFFGTILPKIFSKQVQKYRSQPQRYAIMVLSADRKEYIAEAEMDKNSVYSKLLTLDDKGMAIFERCCLGPTVYGDNDEREIAVSLKEMELATLSDLLGEVCVDEEIVREYNDHIKGKKFDEERKRVSWVYKCLRWCENMYKFFAKTLFLKVINQREDLQFRADEMMDIYRNLPDYCPESIEYGEWIIPNGLDLDEYDVKEKIEEQEHADFYIPTVDEIEEYFRKGLLFSKDYVQDMYKFLVEELGDEKEAAGRCFDFWFDYEFGEDVNYRMKEMLSHLPVLKSKQERLRYLATAFYRKMNMPCYNGHSQEYMESIL